MSEIFIHALRTDDARAEDPAVTRERLKEKFARGATRRMTQLGLTLGAALADLSPSEDDTLVYASQHAEIRALESYLESFPAASPTLFQTSIHPSAVQQALIGRQQAIGHFFPLTGTTHLVVRALQVALLATTPRALLCGGEERGTWLLEQRVASERTFAFALDLRRESSGAIGRLRLETSPDANDRTGSLPLSVFFDALHRRTPLAAAAAPGFALALSWT